jgi:hypothetical protein
VNLRKTAIQSGLAAIVFASVSLAAVACGDDDDGSADGDRAAQEALLDQMVLTEAEVPDELIELSRAFQTNEESANNSNDPEGVLEQFETWGRQLGLSVAFVVNPQAAGPRTFLGVQSDASLYEDDRGCRLSHQDAVDRAHEADWAAAFQQITETEVSEIDAAGIGDEAYWFRVSGVTVAEPQTLLTIDQVLFRVGRARGFLRVEAEFPADAPRNSGQGQVQLWAEFIAMRMRESLSG